MIFSKSKNKKKSEKKAVSRFNIYSNDKNYLFK